MKKTITLVTVVTLLIACAALLPTRAHAAGGTFGENLTWTLDDSGLLTISGNGSMGLATDVFGWCSCF